MTAGPGARGAPPSSTEQELAWAEAHLTELRRSMSEEHFRSRALWFGVVVGLAAHVGGFLLRAAAPTALIGLLGDLLYTLGWGLWTGAVVVVLIQIFPQAKRRQIERALDAYEAALRDRASAGLAPAAPDAGAPPAGERPG